MFFLQNIIALDTLIARNEVRSPRTADRKPETRAMIRPIRLFSGIGQARMIAGRTSSQDKSGPVRIFPVQEFA